MNCVVASDKSYAHSPSMYLDSIVASIAHAPVQSDMN